MRRDSTPAADPARKQAVIYARVSSKEQEKVRKGHRPFRLPLEPIWKP